MLSQNWKSSVIFTEYFGQVSSKDTVSTSWTDKAALIHSNKKSVVVFFRSRSFMKDFSELLHMNTITLNWSNYPLKMISANDLAPFAVPFCHAICKQIFVLITCSFATAQTTVSAAKFRCCWIYKWLAMSKSYFWFTAHAVHVVIHVVQSCFYCWGGWEEEESLFIKKKSGGLWKCLANPLCE